MAECAKIDGTVADVGLVGERDLQDSDVCDDWRRDCSDEKEDRSCKEEEGSNMMESACSCHCVGCQALTGEMMFLIENGTE